MHLHSTHSPGDSPLCLYFAPLPPPDQPGTSQAAAEQAAPKVEGRRRVALGIITGRGSLGRTCDELVQVTGWLIQSATPIVNGLARDILIRESGQRRPTQAGCQAKVWIAAEADG